MRNFIATAFGGVPIGVPIPPTFAANGIESARATRPRSEVSRDRSIGATTASIIAVQAVFDMNIEKTAVTIIIPSMTK